MSSSSRKVWHQKESRHYCEYCNKWMGSDRQSVLLHEQGQKHLKAVEEHLSRRREARHQSDARSEYLQQVKRQIETSAAQASAASAAAFGGPCAATGVGGAPPPPPPPPGGRGPYNYGYQQQQQQPPPPPPRAPAAPSTAPSSSPPASYPPGGSGNQRRQQREELQEWEQRKRQRVEAERARIKAKYGGEDDDEGDAERDIQNPKRSLAPDEGHYRVKGDDGDGNEDRVYLEGPVFGPAVLEEHMPIQIWTGSGEADQEEMKFSKDGWKDGVVAAVRKRRRQRRNAIKEENPGAVAAAAVCVAADETNNDEYEIVADVSYLKSLDAEDETLEKSVPLYRIRILLGDGSFDTIPDTLEEARLMVMGGSVVEVQGKRGSAAVKKEEKRQENGDDDEDDESAAAALVSGWSTVCVKTTSAKQELKEERARLKQKRKQEALEQQQKERLALERKLEEAKIANADDSALGAYDVWNASSKIGYKGVDIHGTSAGASGTAQVSAEDYGKKLASSDGDDGSSAKKIEFKTKKSGFKSKFDKKKLNRRTTSADDD